MKNKPIINPPSRPLRQFLTPGFYLDWIHALRHVMSFRIHKQTNPFLSKWLWSWGFIAAIVTLRQWWTDWDDRLLCPLVWLLYGGASHEHVKDTVYIPMWAPVFWACTSFPLAAASFPTGEQIERCECPWPKRCYLYLAAGLELVTHHTLVTKHPSFPEIPPKDR